MGIIKRFKELLISKKGVTYIEVMLAITLLGISMTYLAYDSRYSSKMLHELSEKDHMLYAAQEAVERYKLDQNGGIKTINGYTVDIASTQNTADDPNLTANLKRVTFIVYPKDLGSGMKNLELISYVFTPSVNTPEAPINLVATPTINSIVLNWDNVNYADSYNVARSTIIDGPYTVIAADIKTNTYIDNTPEIGATYFYTVSALNTYGASAPSNKASAAIMFNTVIVYPNSDSYIRDGKVYAGSNFGTQQQLAVCEWNKKGETRKTYIKFDLSSVSGVITDAKLRVRGRNTSGSSNTILNVKNLSNDAWSENTITWNNAPLEGTTIGTIALNGTANYTEINVNPYIVNEFSGDKQASFVITGSSNNLIEMNSRESTFRPELVITINPAMTPMSPENLKGVPDDKKAVLNWEVSIGAVSYNVKRSVVSGGPYTVVKSGVTAISYTDIGLNNKTPYYYVVSAVNSVGESSNSNEVCVTPSILNTVVLNPEEDSFVRDGTYSDANYGSTAKLEIKNGALSEKRNGLLKFNLSNIRGTLIGAKLRLYGGNIDGSTNIKVDAHDVYGNSWDEETVNYNNAPTLDDILKSVYFDNIQGYREVDLSELISEYFTGGVFELALNSQDAGQLLAINSKESAVNKPELIITKTLLEPEAPKSITAVPDDKSVTLNWLPSLEADSYTVKRSTVDGGPYTTAASGVTSTTFADNGLTNGVTYYYIVTASNLSGESVNSNQVNATPNPSITMTFNPAADSKVESFYPNNNYGSDNVLEVTTNTINRKKSYLRFDLSGYTVNTVVSAKLRIYGNSNVSTYKTNIYGVLDNSWKETGAGSINWNNAPIFSEQIATVNLNTVKQYYEVDITPYIESQLEVSPLITLGLFTDINSNNNAVINSKESLSGKPELFVKMIQGAPKAPTGLTGTGSNRTAALSWNTAEGASSYKVKRAVNKGGTYTTIASNISLNTYNDTTVSNGTTYYYVVSSTNGVGESSNSNEVCVIPNAQAASQVVFAVSDSYNRDGSYLSANYGGAALVNASKSAQINDGNNRDIYLKFDLSTVSPSLKSAVLNIWGNNTTGTKNTTIALNIYLVSNDVWDEFGINYGNAPASSTLINSFTVNKHYGQAATDITNYVKSEMAKDNIITLCIKASTVGYVSAFSSREGTDSPTIIVNY